MKRQTTIIIMRFIEAIAEATNPTGVNKAVAENLIKAPNKGEGDNKTIIGASTKTTADNLTPRMEAITIPIITVVIKAEVAEVAITITNTTKITHMMMVHRWNNMAHHGHFVVVLITLLSIVSKESII